MSVHNTTNHELVEVRNTVFHGVMLRIWDGEAITADIRLTCEQARDLSAALKGAAILNGGPTWTWDDRATATRKAV